MLQQSSNPAPKKGFNWDLLLGRLTGSCIVGCWLIMALLLGIAVYLLAMHSNFWS